MMHRLPVGARYRSLADHESLRELARHLREGLYIADAEGRILDANPSLLAMLGVGDVEELAALGEELYLDAGRRRETLAALARDGAVREAELQLRRPDGETRTVLDTVYAVRDEESGQHFFHGIVLDLSERRAEERQPRDLSMRDPLTGCFNRGYLHEVAARLEERGEGSWGCIHLDLDRFRQYNERHGHAAGDELLLRMSRFLMRQVRAEEAVVRLGGDEFLVVLAGADDARTESVARRLQLAALRTAPAPFSLGWAARIPGEPFEHTVNRAGQRLLGVQVIERSLEWQRRGEE